jgi:sulfur transfer protein SufE
MTTDYILFIHGVNTRDVPEQPEYADSLFKLLQETKPNLKKIALYWGDVNEKAETDLLKKLKASPLWSQMWFQTFREKQILQFAGDTALYISRGIGAQVVKTLKEQALNRLKNAQPDDRLHLVTHSWGTVILFDILFASRWDDNNDVMEIRDTIYGICGKNQNPLQGIQVASLHTMGSPVAIFSLMDVSPGKDNTDSSSGHDITPRLQKLLESLYEARKEKKLPWKNYIHPGDPIAYTLEELMSSLVDGDKKYLDIHDMITQEPGLFDFVIAQTVLALLHGGDAHGSYWHSKKVAQEISSVL